MTPFAHKPKHRILVIDDNRAIHDDIRKVFEAEQAAPHALIALAADLFDEPTRRGSSQPLPSFVIDSAFQGPDGLELLRESHRQGDPYAVAFVDMRMPPGWDGIETIRQIRAHDPFVQIVICTAYAEYSWADIMDQLAEKDGLLILRKPFDGIELVQMAHALAEKWMLRRMHAERLADLEKIVAARTRDLVETTVQLRAEVERNNETLARLATSEATFKALVDSLSDAVFVHRERVIQYVNPAMLRLLGYDTAEQLCGRTPAETFVHPADLGMLKDFLQRREAGEIMSTLHIRWLKRDGVVLVVEAESTAILFDGRPAIVSIGRDVTEKVRMESERQETSRILRLSEERYRLLFEHSPLPKFIFDSNSFRFLQVNAAAVQLYGYTAEEFLTMSLADLKMPEDMPALIPEVPDMTTGHDAVTGIGPVWKGTKKYRTKDGRVVDVDIKAHSVFVDGRPAMLAIGNDVTEARRLEQHVRQAQKMDAIGMLAGGVAHDFNNILSVILGYTDVLVEDLQPEDPMRADLEEVGSAGRRAAELTRHLLAFSRKQVLEPKISSVNDILAGMDRMLRRLLGEDMELSVHTAPALGKVYADPGQIEQVIMNLVVNARDATAHGGQVSVETENVELDAAYCARHSGVTPGRYVMVVVSDTGVGMDEATQARIFEPFFTTKDEGKGTGLGLSTVIGIVEQSGGYVSVDSTLGKGTTFKVYLPRTDRVADAVSVVPPSLTSLRGSETILVVDDDDQVRAVIQTILRRAGYNVLQAQNAGEAFLICEKHTSDIHLLITDVVMPRMTGPELAERIGPMRPTMKILYISGYTENAFVHQSAHDSRIDFLAKPITPASLSKKVGEVLGSSRTDERHLAKKPADSVAPSPMS